MPDICTLYIRAHLVANALDAEQRPDSATLMRDLGNLALSSHRLVTRALDMMRRSDADSGGDVTADEWFALMKDMDALLQKVPA